MPLAINFGQDAILTGDMRNPKACIYAVFPSCTGTRQASLELRRQNLGLFRGDDLEITCTVRDESRLPVDISNVERLRWWLARDQFSTALITKERQRGDVLFSGDIILMGTTNKFRFLINRPDTVDLTPGRYYWEVEIFTDNQRTITAAFGSFNLRPELIRESNAPEE